MSSRLILALAGAGMAGLVGLLTHMPVAALPSGEAGLSIRYDLAVGGFALGTAELDARFIEDSYDMDARVTTEGLADLLFNAEFQAESTGRIESGDLYTRRYAADYANRSGSRALRLDFEADPALVVAEPPFEDDPEDRVDSRHAIGARDPFSAALIPITSGDAHPCERPIPVFDGRRRYDLKLLFDGETEIVSADEDTYSGPAIRCRILIEPVAGNQSKRFIRMLEEDGGAKVWLAPLVDGQVYVPVKLTLRTPYGVAIARASRFEETRVASR